MRITIDGQVFENPNYMLIEVKPEGETVGPWVIELVGGWLTVQGEPGKAALTLKHEKGGIRFLAGESPPPFGYGHELTRSPGSAGVM